MQQAWWLIASWTLRATIAFLVLTALAPFLRVGWWPVRLCDFPRLQLGALALVVLLAVVGWAFAQGWRIEHAALIALALAVAVWQLSHAAPYTALWSKASPDAAPDADIVRLAVLNLDYRNPKRDEALRVIEGIDADLLVLVEVDRGWEEALAPLAGRYPHRAGAVLDDGLGLLVWSRLPLRGARTRYIVTDERPSIWTEVDMGAGGIAYFVAVHPSPPGLKTDDGDREDSRKRDAELVLVAKQVAEHSGRAHIVAGDFNDVAWSHTTRLFERLSGLKDPRIGRGLFSTYHARYPMLRYPIDQVFVSEGFATARLDRVRIPGSDHLGIISDLALVRQTGSTPDADGGDHEEAREIVDEGREDAAKDGER
jgi:endonuclease/exonuclease/phosphatase (EEP) superfamily protein YafD